MDNKQTETPKMDPAGLWREETFTDRKVGTIRRLTPVTAAGAADLARKPIFVGEASLMTPAGALPLSFEIPAADLAEAVARYSEALEIGLQDAMKELQELRRRASSQIVIPQGGMPSGGLPPVPGASKLKLP